jgi:hypothetical protein
MHGQRPDRYDYAFSLLGLVLSYFFLVLAKRQGWSLWQSLALLVAAAIPVGLTLGLLKWLLQIRARNVR